LPIEKLRKGTRREEDEVEILFQQGFTCIFGLLGNIDWKATEKHPLQ
jgi:hypothetical protein